MTSTSNRFSEIQGLDKWDAEMLNDAYGAITTTQSWDKMKNFNGESFMFSSEPWISNVMAAMHQRDNHSGASFGWTMRQMESIAKRGWEEHKTMVREAKANRQLEEWAATQRKPKGNPCYCRAAKGFTDGWCGVAGGGVPACDH